MFSETVHGRGACCFLQVDSDNSNDPMRSKLRGHPNAAVYSLVSVPHGYDIATIFELDATTMTKEPTVPRSVITRNCNLLMCNV